MASQTNSYTANAICGTFASQYSYIDPGLFSSANLTGLTPATKYYYRVGALVRSCCSSPLKEVLHSGSEFRRGMGDRNGALTRMGNALA